MYTLILENKDIMKNRKFIYKKLGAIFILASSVGCLILFILTKSTDAKLGQSEN